MNPQLLPKDKLTIDSIVNGPDFIYRRFIEDDEQHYFALHHEYLADDGGLDPTGRLIAILQTPHGTQTFFLTKQDDLYVLEEEDDDINSDQEDLSDEEKNAIAFTAAQYDKLIFQLYLAMMNQAIAELFVR